MKPRLGRVEIWAPEFCRQTGGIQAFSSFLLEACRELLPKRVVQGRAKRGEEDPGDPEKTIHGRSTLSFALNLALENVIRPPALIISTHVNFSPVARWVSRLRAVPYVVVGHGVEVWGEIKSRRRKALRGSAQVWAVSRYTRDRLISEQGIAPERAVIFPNTFDEDRFSPGPRPRELMARYHLPPEAKIIFSVGRLSGAERYKGFDRVIQALPQIRAVIPEVRYVVGGQGDDRRRLEALARDLGVSDRVVFAGFIPPEELCDHYQLCDVFAMPSTGEGFGIVYLEALACGRPVLAGFRDGSTEPLADGRFGVLVDPGNIDEITRALVGILRGDSGTAQTNALDIRETMIAQFGFRAFCTRLGGQLDDLLARPRAEGR